MESENIIAQFVRYHKLFFYHKLLYAHSVSNHIKKQNITNAHDVTFELDLFHLPLS